MSQAYEREQQNNSRLDELASKVSALRGVTIDIYDNARDQGVIDSTSRIVRYFLILLNHAQGLSNTIDKNGVVGE
ncbi:snare complex subunit protein [Pyrenophora tritici-repentis]|nr:snare complex subunit protein [Pyrenophora tritici-repentis]